MLPTRVVLQMDKGRVLLETSRRLYNYISLLPQFDTVPAQSIGLRLNAELCNAV